MIDLDEFVDGYSQYMSLVTTGQFLTVTRELSPKLFLKTEEPIPSGATLVENWNAGKIKLYKHTYPANDPSEDRSTLVVGDDFLFCGVWDGAQRAFPALPCCARPARPCRAPGLRPAAPRSFVWHRAGRPRRDTLL